MALLNVDLSVTQGEDWNGSWVWASPDPSGEGDLAEQVYFDFTACGARMVVRVGESATSLSLLGLTAGSGIVFSSIQADGGPAAPPYPNAFTVAITKAQSLALNNGNAGSFFYDLFVDWTDGTSTCFLQGGFVVVPSVTR